MIKTRYKLQVVTLLLSTSFSLSLSASMVKVGCTLQRTGKKGKKHADYYGTAVYWLKGGKKKGSLNSLHIFK